MVLVDDGKWKVAHFGADAVWVNAEWLVVEKWTRNGYGGWSIYGSKLVLDMLDTLYQLTTDTKNMVNEQQ